VLHSTMRRSPARAFKPRLLWYKIAATAAPIKGKAPSLLSRHRDSGPGRILIVPALPPSAYVIGASGLVVDGGTPGEMQASVCAQRSGALYRNASSKRRRNRFSVPVESPQGEPDFSRGGQMHPSGFFELWIRGDALAPLMSS